LFPSFSLLERCIDRMAGDLTGFGMSEEKIEGKLASEQNNLEPIQSAEAEPQVTGKFTGQLNPVILLLFMIFAMLMILAITVMGRFNSNGESSDNSDNQVKNSDIEAQRSELNRQRIAMGLSPLDGASESAESIAKRLRTDAETLAGMANKLQQLLADKDLELSASNAESLRLLKLRQVASMENARLQSELERIQIDSSDKDRLKTQLIDAQAQKEAISQELANARQKLAEQAGSVSRNDFADLQHRYNEVLRAKEFYEARAKELEASISKAKLFANSEMELLPAAVELFRRLRKMEGMKDSDFTTEYSNLGVQLGASVLYTLDFATGSSELNEEDFRRIEAIAAEVPDGDLTLIIGYASETGNSESNQTLSSDRATSAAEYFASKKRPGQLVQAVYLGQTDRFSSRVPERNQICEVWRIRKK
jgi:outer membrane protein OmpA-like peptidoglycan-associated protein